MRYCAFLSYSHEDARWAAWLLRRIEGYRVPKRLVGRQGRNGLIPARLGTVFRDRDELPSAGDLGSTIKSALAESAALVLICSPAAAKSRWVNAEAEAFREFGRADRIFAFVVDGDPTGDDLDQACFPPALLAPDRSGEPAREPLAADARSEGDGRERAFLKIVAGLLGIGFDSLAQREAQRQNRRLAIIATASFLGMAVALALAATAYVARNDALRRQAQAEDIVGFMLGDLREKLATVGRLDLMRAVDDKATDYFAMLNPRDLSDRALEEQARSLTGVGQVRLDEGKHDAAMAAFREAHARSGALYQRQLGNGRRLYDLAQAEYWIGFVAWQQGRFDDARVWLGTYRDSAIKLAAMDRTNFDWQKEVGYGHHNLAVLDESLGHYAQAERSMLEERQLYRGWIRQRPKDLDLRSEAANIASWLGSLALRQGRLADAETYFIEEDDAVRRTIVDDPGNANWKSVRVGSLLRLADAQVQRGRLPEARASVKEATSLAALLSASDPDNNSWRVSLGNCRSWQAQLEAGAPVGAVENANAAAALLAKAHLVEPKNEKLLTWLARAREVQSRLALDRGDGAEARRRLAAALALVEPAWRSAPNESLRLRLAKLRLLEGELAQQEGHDAQATRAWIEARQLLLADAASPLPFPRLDPLVRAYHFLGQGAAAAPQLLRLQAAGYVPLTPFPALAPTPALEAVAVGPPVH